VDWVLFALIAIPLGSVPVFMLIPSRYPQMARSFAAASGFSMFALSLLVFARYEFKGGSGLRFDFRLDWLENVAFLKEDGITLHLAVDGISVPLVLLTGIVIPMVLLFAVNSTDAPIALLVAIAVCVIGGTGALRYAILKAGMYTPLIPANKP